MHQAVMQRREDMAMGGNNSSALTCVESTHCAHGNWMPVALTKAT